MLSIARHTLRTRWGAFVGSFVALMLGVALLSTMGLVLAATVTAPERGPGRFAAAPVVVRGAPALTVTDSWGGRDKEPLAEPRGLSDALVAKARTAGRTVLDRSFPVQLAGGPDRQVGHAWPSAALAPYRLTAGRPPASDDEIVVGGFGGIGGFKGTGGTGATSGTSGFRGTSGIGDAKPDAKPGDKVTVLTPERPRSYTVSGVTAPVPFENALFFSEREAARLSPRVDALVSYGPADAVRAAVGDKAQVLTGDDRRDADPRAKEDSEALVGVSSLLGMAAGVAAFVSVSVIASTFAYSVVQRRRELALMRLAGATPRQVRRLVLGEAKIVGIAASAAGCALSVLGGPLLADWLAGHGIAPEWFSVPLTWLSVLLVLAAFALGVLLAWLGAGVAALRAGRTRPLEALHDSEAEADRKAMTTGRRLLGLTALACGIGLLAGAPLLPPLYWAGLTALVAPALILAFALLSPMVIPLIARLVTAPSSALSRGAGTMLVRAAALTSIRRTAATAAPVLITVGLACSLWSTSGSIQTARSREAEHQVRAADMVVVPVHAPGLSRAVVDRVRAARGVDAAATTPTTVFTVPGPDALLYPAGAPLLPYPARAVTPSALTAVMKPSVVSGKLADLGDDTIVVDESWNRSVGDKVRVWLADGREVSLRVAAVLKTGLGDNGVFVSPRYAGTRLSDAVYVRLRPGADPATARGAVAAAARDGFAEAVPLGRWSARVDARKAEETRLALLVIGGIAVLYTGVAIANTLAMSTRHRARELALLRLSGLTPAQVLRVVAAEALLVVAVGVVLAAGVAALSLGGLWFALRQIVSGAPVVIPAGPVVGIAAACAVIALLATVVPAWYALRTPAVRFTSTEG
ncbi:FtsX-like permease family protein [Streptomyces sp. NPDC050610]|uniref:ABC transporter permease n=1 Tax=Streptomyces sp. NPDC050610 TaxID=3157097 RepID=UPI0034347C6C